MSQIQINSNTLEEKKLPKQQPKPRQRSIINAFTRYPTLPQIVIYLCSIFEILTFYIIIQQQLKSNIMRIVFIVVYSVALVSKIGTSAIVSFIDPSDPSIYQLSQSSEKQQIISLNLLYCHECKSFVKLKSKHCRKCNRCVQQFDHHCVWINNCIGSKNYRWFISMLCSVQLQMTMYIIGCTFLTVQKNYDNINQSNYENNQHSYPMYLIILIWINMGIVCIFWMLNLYLLSIHIYLIKSGLSTYEWLFPKLRVNEIQQQYNQDFTNQNININNNNIRRDQNRSYYSQNGQHIQITKENQNHQEQFNNNSLYSSQNREERSQNNQNVKRESQNVNRQKKDKAKNASSITSNVNYNSHSHKQPSIECQSQEQQDGVKEFEKFMKIGRSNKIVNKNDEQQQYSQKSQSDNSFDKQSLKRKISEAHFQDLKKPNKQDMNWNDEPTAQINTEYVKKNKTGINSRNNNRKIFNDTKIQPQINNRYIKNNHLINKINQQQNTMFIKQSTQYQSHFYSDMLINKSKSLHCFFSRISKKDIEEPQSRIWKKQVSQIIKNQ